MDQHRVEGCEVKRCDCVPLAGDVEIVLRVLGVASEPIQQELVVVGRCTRRQPRATAGVMSMSLRRTHVRAIDR